MTTEECIQLFTKIKLNDLDYERMIDCDCSKINKKLSYDQFIQWNIKCIIESTDDDKLFFKMLCNKIINNDIGQMDLESCSVFDTCSVFFSTNKKLIIVNQR